MKAQIPVVIKKAEGEKLFCSVSKLAPAAITRPPIANIAIQAMILYASHTIFLALITILSLRRT